MSGVNLPAELKAAFENTVLCARTNPAQDSYGYATKMEQMITKQIQDKNAEVIAILETHGSNPIIENAIQKLKNII